MHLALLTHTRKAPFHFPYTFKSQISLPYHPFQTPVHDKVSPELINPPRISGGEEVMLDQAGKDCSDTYEDVGHSDEAREILETLRVGNLKRLPGEGPQRVAPERHPFVPRDFSGMPGGVRVGGALAGALLASAIAYLGYVYIV